MTKFLVSVQSESEFEQAFAAGVAWIDLKDPRRGSLGRPSPSLVDYVDAFSASNANPPLNGKETVLSLAWGELRESIENAPRLPSTFQFVKTGLAGCRNFPLWRDVARDWSMRLAAGELILVHYADSEVALSPSFEEILEVSAEMGAKYLLIDTYSKSGKKLTDWLSVAQLHQNIRRATNRGISLSLAGSLSLQDIEHLSQQIFPSVWAVRSAICRDGMRRESICPIRLQKYVELEKRFQVALPTT